MRKSLPSNGNVKFAKRFRLFGDKNGAVDGALCGRRKEHRRELPIHRYAALEQARLSPIAAVVFVGLDQRRPAGGVDQRRSPAPFRDAEIPKPLIWRGLERCRAARRHRVDAVSFRWRAALVCLFCAVQWRVLRAPGHQAVRRRTAVCLPSLLSARIHEPAGINPSAGTLEVATNPDAIGRQREHVR